MSTPDRDLLKLAQLAGVAPRYRDVWNRPRDVSLDTLRAILGAMGFAVASEHEIAASIAAQEAAEWRLLLPPVVTMIAGDAAAAPVTIEEGREPRLAWRLLLDSGEERRGELPLEDAPVLARRRDGAQRWRRWALPLDPGLPPGYHRLRVSAGAAAGETVLIVAPRRCHLPDSLAGSRRGWALTAQLYGLRSSRNMGIGDFTDLAALAEGAATHGAASLGINPLHALFPAEPRHISPYSPSSRLFLNPLYIAIEAVPDFAGSTKAQARLAAPATRTVLAALRDADLVDYANVATLKHALFDLLYRHFAEHDLAPGGEARSVRGAAFRRFQREGGKPLADYATFTALHEERCASGHGFFWNDWPAALRDAASPEIARFAAERRDRIELHQYLQWEADRQLGAAAGASRLAVGLYRDLAVGVDPNGAEAWADHRMMTAGAAVGAPPDILNMRGQDWGLAPVNPVALRAAAYAPFIAALRANMRHAGVLRIDHVMALKQLYWVPRGASPAQGTYVAYPFDDLRRIVALESHRHRCAVIGEDLGTVPKGFREAMQETGVLSYRLMLFERDRTGHFLPPDAYPELASAAFSTHDIATLKGFWLGRDLAWRRELDLYPDREAAEQDPQERRRDRRRLLDALIRAGVLPEVARARLLPREDEPLYEPELAEAIHRFLARSKSRLVLMQIEDVLGELEQANLPGTVDEHPNWRRRLGLSLDRILADPHFARLAAIITEEQGRS
jgi:4-alpha-glucanotransferase